LAGRWLAVLGGVMVTQGDILSGRYLLAEQIGAGGMGTVFRAVDLRTGGEVAVKIPHPFLVSDKVFVERLRREAQAAAALHSPRIARVTDFAEHQGTPYLVMEYVPGLTLAERIERDGPLPPAEALHIAFEVARALDAAHQRGVTHRDLKPQNIRLDGDDVKVLDFGIARMEGFSGLTSASTLIGSPEYLAPERAEGPGDVRADLYSLGVILYQMLSGKVPFDGGTPFTIMRRHATEAPPPLPPGLPQPVYPIVERCLAKRPEDRFQAPRELAGALQEALQRLEEERVTRRLAARAPLADGRTLDLPRPLQSEPGEPAGSPAPASTAAPAGARPPERPDRPAAVSTEPGPTVAGAPSSPPAPRRRLWLLAASIAVLALVVLGAGLLLRRGGAAQPARTAVSGQPGGPATEGATRTVAPAVPPAVSILFPAEGAQVTPPVRIEVGVTGATLKAPTEGDSSARHLHYFIDADPAAVMGPGEPVPVGRQNIIHTPLTSQTLDLPPGEHTVWVVLTDNNHVPLTSAAVAKTTFTVTGTPARSGDQAPIVYQSLVGSRWRLFVVDGAGRTPRQLSGGNFDDLQPAWSPDGSQVAFVSNRDGAFHLYVMNADGSNVRQLTRGGAQERSPAWSPDGRFLAFVSNQDGGRNQIFVMPAEGGEARQLTRGAANAGSPSWSPDGRQIVFHREQGELTQLFVVDVESGEAKQMTSGSMRAINPAWSPDGRRIAFAAFRDNAWNIFLINSDGSGLTQVTTTGEVNDFPAWSPDGRQLVFASGREGQQQIFVLALDGSAPRRVTEGLAHSLHPAWPRR
jgi:hypothetical protein